MSAAWGAPGSRPVGLSHWAGPVSVDWLQKSTMPDCTFKAVKSAFNSFLCSRASVQTLWGSCRTAWFGPDLAETYSSVKKKIIRLCAQHFANKQVMGLIQLIKNRVLFLPKTVFLLVPETGQITSMNPVKNAFNPQEPLDCSYVLEAILVYCVCSRHKSC